MDTSSSFQKRGKKRGNTSPRCRVIYPISDSKWVSPVHCIPKKGGVSLVTNENNDLVPTRAVIGYGMCVDFRKLNKWTKKDHYRLPFINEILQRLANNRYF